MIGRGFAGLSRVRGTPAEPKLGIIVRRKINIKRTTSPPKPNEIRPKPDSGIGVRFVAPFFDGSGYAEGARQWLAAMVTAGIDVRAEPVSFETARADYGLAGEIAKKAVNREIDCKISMIYLTPDMYPLHRKEGHYNIGLFEWETDKLPNSWIHECNAMDEIWVPCSWVADIAKAGGVKIPIRIVGHCFNPEEYRDVPPMDFPELPEGCFKFYSIFQWTERKNPKGLLEAYLSAFRKKDPVVLILKTYRANYSADEQHWIIGEIERIKNTFGEKSPRILLIPEMLTRKEILSLHATGDCFVLPHRGEGWGLPHFEACVSGKPVITTGYGGNIEYMDDKTAYLLDGNIVNVDIQSPIRWYTKDMLWFTPNEKQLIKKMRYVYANRGRASVVASKAKERVYSRYTWPMVGSVITGNLRSILSNKDAGPRIPESKVTPHPEIRNSGYPANPQKIWPEVLWNGHMYDYSGYGKANREIVLRVSNTIKVGTIESHQENYVVEEHIKHKLDALKHVPIKPNSPMLRFFGPDYESKRTRHRIVWTMMETYKIHPSMVNDINRNFDELWTPTEWNREVFVSSGVSIPSRTMPLGINNNIYKVRPKARLPLCRLLTGPRSGTISMPDGYVFISLGLPSFRKGYDIIARAFESDFSEIHDVHLVMAVTHSTPTWNEEVYNQFAKYKSSIWTLEGMYSEHEMARIYSSCDAYVTASRGEGWNLPACEAAACGLPVICPDNTSHPEVFGRDAFVFPCEGTSIHREGDWISGWYKGMPFSKLGERSVKRLSEIMTEVHGGGNNIRLKAESLRNRVASKWSWDAAANMVVSRLLEVQP